MAVKAKAKAKASTNGVNRIEKHLKGETNGHSAPAEKVERLTITPPKLRKIRFKLVGTAPFMQLRFSQKAMNKMIATQEAGGQSRSKKTREARDFDDDYKQAFHRMANGDAGIPCAAIRNACVSACRMAGFKMTHAKLSIFVESDGLDVVDATPLIKIVGNPEKTIMAVRNQTGVADMRCRPMWKEWHAICVIRFDMDQFSASDIFNLLSRAGQQVGIGEGRADSKNSCGLGYGFFEPQLVD